MMMFSQLTVRRGMQRPLLRRMLEASRRNRLQLMTTSNLHSVYQMFP